MSPKVIKLDAFKSILNGGLVKLWGSSWLDLIGGVQAYFDLIRKWII